MTTPDPSWLEDYRCARHQEQENLDYEAQRRADRIADYTPAPSSPQFVTSAMVALAFAVVSEEKHEEAARALAELVLGEDG